MICAAGSLEAVNPANTDRRYHGIRFRMVDEQGPLRLHLRMFFNGEQAAGLSQPLRQTDEAAIVQVLTGVGLCFAHWRPETVANSRQALAPPVRKKPPLVAAIVTTRAGM